MAALTLIGYWRSDRDPEWPDPRDFVDESWDGQERHEVAAYLASGTIPWDAAGFSPCRLCGKPNGSAEFTDGVFLWPEGLAHYVRDHAVCLPKRVLDHIRSRWDDLEQPEVDRDWWRTASRT